MSLGWAVVASAGMACAGDELADQGLIPLPASVKVLAGGDFVAGGDVVVSLPPQGELALPADCEQAVATVVRQLRADTGMPLVISNDTKRGRSLDFVHDEGIPGKESCRIQVGENHIEVRASAPAGFFYAGQTLRQLVRQQVKSPAQSTPPRLPSLLIDDTPRFRHRGFMLDCSRHFFPKETILRVIDLMAERKLNVFHWHLVDGPGWRLEIKGYPRLTEVGAWRKDKRAEPWNWRATELCVHGREPGAYGGFYSAADVREIRNYAAERFVEILPEIEMPGHSYVALAAYPQFACDPSTILSEGLRGRDVFCATNPAGRAFLKTTLDETMRLFPDSSAIHLGGDEVPPEAWANCPKCRESMQRLPRPSPHALQAEFMTDMIRHVTKAQRRVVVWNDAIGPDEPLPDHATVMVWTNPAAARAITARGGEVIMAPISHLYLDYALSPVPPGDAPSSGAGPSLEKVYAFDPAGGLAEAEQPLVRGVEACLWTEHVQTEARALALMLPRLDALAEMAWSPQAQRSWPSFSRRLAARKPTVK